MNKLQSQALQQLVQHNIDVLKPLLGTEFIEKSRRGLLTPTETQAANRQLAGYLYSDKIARHVYEGEYGQLNTEFEEKIKQISAGRPELPWNNLGLIVVRPELYHACESIFSFLNDRQFRVIYEKSAEIDFAQYKLLYHPGLIDPESREDFPTRTLSYINQPCKLIVFTDPTSRYQVPLSAGFTDDFKGDRGKRQPGTLRGDLVIKEMLALGVELPLNDEVALAFDPIQSYRHIVAGTIPSDQAHHDAELPLLFYAGVGIHIPDADEIQRDMNILFSHDELQRISHEYEDRRNYSSVH